MSTVLVAKKINISRQEGDTADVEMIIPDGFDMTAYSGLFQVYNSHRDCIITKTTAGNGGITIDGQKILVKLDEKDTDGFGGTHSWFYRILKEGVRLTIGKGQFIIIREDA